MKTICAWFFMMKSKPLQIQVLDDSKMPFLSHLWAFATHLGEHQE